MKTLLVFLISFSYSVSKVSAQAPADTGLVKWISLSNAIEQNKKVQKPFIIDFYTDWCGWCKHMLKTTYASPDLANYINTYFYPVKFNAEGKDTVEFQGVKYVNPGNTSRSTHQFAVKMLGNKLSYPSTVFLANNLQYTLLTAGYLDVAKIEPILVFLVENVYRTTAYEEFEKDYKLTFTTSNLGKETIWTTLKDWEKSKSSKKKTIIYIDAAFCNSCKVFKKEVIGDSSLTTKLRKNFTLINIPADSKDTIQFKDVNYHRSPGSKDFFHPLIMSLTKGNVNLPTCIILNEKEEVIDIIPYYLSHGQFANILEYYGTDAYLSKKFDVFLKEKK